MQMFSTLAEWITDEDGALDPWSCSLISLKWAGSKNGPTDFLMFLKPLEAYNTTRAQNKLCSMNNRACPAKYWAVIGG